MKEKHFRKHPKLFESRDIHVNNHQSNSNKRVTLHTMLFPPPVPTHAYLTAPSCNPAIREQALPRPSPWVLASQAICESALCNMSALPRGF